MYFLKLSGYIPENKLLEFEQTYRLASTQIPKSCLAVNFYKDLLAENTYHMITYWSVRESADNFSKSNTYYLLSGAFATLGTLIEKKQGESPALV